MWPSMQAMVAESEVELAGSEGKRGLADGRWGQLGQETARADTCQGTNPRMQPDEIIRPGVDSSVYGTGVDAIGPDRTFYCGRGFSCC
jgi:hypothetical protein